MKLSLTSSTPLFVTKLNAGRLPTPAEVTARSPDFRTSSRPTPVKFEHLNLIVKFGPWVTVEEGICLRMLPKAFPGKVPLPEVYGWRVEEGCVYIYMELIQGETLHCQWVHLNEQERLSICAQLDGVVFALRQAEQDATDPFIGRCIRIRINCFLLMHIVGSVTSGPLLDYVLYDMPSPGPFKTVKEFNDWFSTLPQRRLPDSLKFIDPY